MEDHEITITATTEPPAPTGEEITPEAEVKTEETPEGTPVVPEEVSPEEAEEKTAIKDAGLTEGTPAAHEFAKLRREKRDAKRIAEERLLEIERWKGRADALAEMGQKKGEVTAQPEPIIPEKPKEEDFSDYGSFIEALTDWKTDIKIAEVEKKRLASEEIRTKTEAQKARDAWISQGQSKFKDFDAVVAKPYDQGGPAITNTMAEIINDSSFSHELAYHLGKNVEESRRIAALPPLAAARELGKLEAKLTSTSTVKPRIQTNAPAPIKPVSGDGATAEIIDLEKMSEGDYIATMNRKEFGR
jgi:hypothetical protein